jgi:AraC family transcriptional regulator
MGYKFRMGSDGSGARLMRGVRFIERNIERRLSLAEVAAEAALSDYHFHRLFRARYGMAVMDYVRRRRLTQAAEQLLRTPAPIIEIAMNAAFESQAAFTRAFRRIYATTPGAYRSRGRDVPWMSVEPLNDDVLCALPELGRGSPSLRWCDELRVAGLEACFTGEARRDIPALWQRFAETMPRRLVPGARFIGLSDGSRIGREGLFRYHGRVGPGRRCAAPAGLTPRSLAAGIYLCFDFEGAPERLPSAIDYILGAWIPGSGQVLREAPSFELYDPDRRTPGTVRIDAVLSGRSV